MTHIEPFLIEHVSSHLNPDGFSYLTLQAALALLDDLEHKGWWLVVDTLNLQLASMTTGQPRIFVVFPSQLSYFRVGYVF